MERLEWRYRALDQQLQRRLVVALVECKAPCPAMEGMLSRQRVVALQQWLRPLEQLHYPLLVVAVRESELQ